MRKFLYTFLTLIFIVSVQVFPIHAAGKASITITPETVEAHPGDSVTFTLTANNPTGTKVEAASGTFSVDQGLTIEHTEILCKDYFSMTEYVDKEERLTCSSGGTEKGTWSIVKVTCKVDSNATMGKKSFTFTVDDFGPASKDVTPLIDIGTSYKATINVTHSGEHTWNAGEVTKEATCTETGEKTFKCTVPGCDGTKKETIQATGHNLTAKKPFDWVIDDNDKAKATATAIVKCSNKDCKDYGGDGKTVNVDKIDVDIKDATCINPGTITFTGQLFIDGKLVETDKKEVSVEKLDHIWGEPTEVKWNDNIVTVTRYCTRPGDTNTSQTTTGTGTLVKEDATCTKAGTSYYTADVEFQIDHTKYTGIESEHVNIPAIGHKYPDSWTVKTPATCTTNGLEIMDCMVCGPDGNNRQEEGWHKEQPIQATGHKYPDDWKVETPATCGADGLEVKECTVCGPEGNNTQEPDWRQEHIIPATGLHEWPSEWTVTMPPTYEMNGEQTKTCPVCNTVDKQSIDKLKPEIGAALNTGSVKASITEGTLKSALDSMVKEALAGNVPAGMDEAVAKAILEAGKSTEENSLSVTSELIVEDAGTTPTITGIDADSILKTYNIHIDVTVKGTGLDANGVTGQITETSQPISFIVPKPEGGPIYYVMRDHSGWAKIGSRVDGSNIIFSSNLFSDFSIISSNNLADADVEPIPNQTYTGKEITPKVKVTINGGEELTEGVDYIVTYSNNTEIGTATVVIKAVEGSDARFTGSKTVTFQIVKQADDANGAGAAGNGNNKNTSSPATGDEASIALYAVLAIFAAVVAAGVALRRRYQK